MTHHLKLALRHLWKKKLYSVVILLSLTVGFACTNLLLSFLIAELNVDSFHANKEQLFQVVSDDPFAGKNRITYVPAAVQKHLLDNYPEVRDACSISILDKATLSIDGIDFRNTNIVLTDASFFNLFSFPLSTHTKNILALDNVVLSREKATILFGENDPLGKTISLTAPDSTGTMVNRLLTVSAIMEQAPEKSHLAIDALIDMNTFPARFRGGNGYVMLNGADETQLLEQKLNQDKLRPGLTGLGTVNYYFNPLEESYFNKSNPQSFTKTKSKLFVWVGSIICFLILFMASFNFINLLLLSFQSRKKETGIKKTLGASLKSLFQATLSEVFIYLTIAFVFSLALAFLLLPVFNTTLQTALSFQYFSRISVMSSIGLLVFVLAAIVVAVATVNQWRIKPISLMQNQTSKVAFNKLLFTLQFVISITMAICSVTIIKQMNFIENEPLGFNRNIIELTAPDKESREKLPRLKEKLLQLSGIDNATVCSGNPISGNRMVLYEIENGESYSPYIYNGDEDFFKTLDLKLIEGKLPSANEPDGVVVNEKLVSFFNMKHPVGERVPGTKSSVIIGVVKNFTSGSFKVETPAVIINYATADKSLLISFTGNQLSTLLPQIETRWNELLAGNPFSYRILQQELLNKYKEETSFFRIVITFAFVCMIISCFGLFALSWAVVQNRTKEIGIRKVLGAHPKDIVSILSITFLQRIVVAFLIAAPIGYIAMNQWLNVFVKKISLGADIFVWSALLVCLIAMITLGLQTVKAALSNPVKELRSE